MIGLIIPFIYFLLCNALIVFISKKTFGKCIPLAILIPSFIYFFSQIIFHTFKVGFYINILLPIIGIGIILYKVIKKENIEEFKKNYLSNGFYVFIVMCLFIFIFDFRRNLSNWDEWSHWGIMIKEMLRLDRFYSIAESTLMVHKDYPPIMQMFELFFINLTGTFKESSLISSIHLFSFSLFIPAIAEDKNKKLLNIIIKSIVIIFIILLLFLSFDQHKIINCIYIDYSMAILIAYLLFSIINEKELLSNFSLINLSIGCSFLLLLKQIGLPLYLMILFMFFICQFLRDKKVLFEKKNIIKMIIILLLIPLSLWKGWSMYVSTLDVEKQFDLSEIKPLELIGVIQNKSGEEWQKTTAQKYIIGIQTSNISNTQFNLSFIQCMLLVYVTLVGLYYLFRKELDKKEMILLGVTLGIGAIGYSLVMLFLYISAFGPEEGSILTSYDRYMTTYILICLSTFLMIYLNKDSTRKKETYLYLLPLFALLFLIQKPERIGDVFPKIYNSYNPYQELGEYLATKVEQNSKVFILTQDSDGEYQYVVKYYAGAITTNPKFFEFETDNIDDYESYFKENYEQKLLEYDYLYILKIDDDFKEKYKFLFDEEINIKDIYKIINQNNELKLKKIS